MVFGRNTNLKLGDATFHIQTEDRGETHALIDTVVYQQGRVLLRRATNYSDLLPLDDDRRQALKLRLDDQHAAIIDEIRSGALQLKTPAPPPPAPAAKPEAAPKVQLPRTLVVELANPKSCLSGKQAVLLLTVRQENGEPAVGAKLIVEMEGSDNGVPFQGQTDASGRARVEFEMPRITSPEAALVIHAEDHTAKGHLRFALRSKPRVA
jgi:hypothetical protein